MQKSRIILTKHQLDFARTTEYPLTKHAIIQYIVQLFEELGQSLQHNGWESSDKAFKITRGENYQLMPYVVLDYPQLKANDFNLVTRTLFWWGNYCSLNLIVHKDLVKDGTIKLEEPLYLLTDDQLWNNNINVGYKLVDFIDKSTVSAEFIRLAKVIKIEEIDSLPELVSGYKAWIKLLLKTAN